MNERPPPTPEQPPTSRPLDSCWGHEKAPGSALPEPAAQEALASAWTSESEPFLTAPGSPAPPFKCHLGSLICVSPSAGAEKAPPGQTAPFLGHEDEAITAGTHGELPRVHPDRTAHAELELESPAPLGPRR